jgi:hypothetical protein
VAVTSKATDSKSLAALFSAAAVRQRCRWFLEAARAGTLKHFVYDDSMLDDCVQIVAQETRTNYPDLVVYVREAQNDGAGLVVYNRKEGRALG